MRDHELELIAALVEGRLDDESEARALVASSPEFSNEYEAQKLAYEALTSGAGTVALTDAERSTLHRDVWSALRASPPSRAPSPWYFRWAPVAAALLVVVGLIAVINQGGSLDGADRFAADEATETSAAAAEADPADDAGEGGEATTLSESSDTDSLPEEVVAFYARRAEQLREGGFAGAEAYSEESAHSRLETCLEDAGLIEYTIVATPTTPTTKGTGDSVDPPPGVTSFIAAIPADADLSTAPIAFVDPVDCKLIHVDK
ncbi:MAG: hypothetical protein ACRDU9_01120 [Acidimicrobiia bacterium]